MNVNAVSLGCKLARSRNTVEMEVSVTCITVPRQSPLHCRKWGLGDLGATSDASFDIVATRPQVTQSTTVTSVRYVPTVRPRCGHWPATPTRRFPLRCAEVHSMSTDGATRLVSRHCAGRVYSMAGPARAPRPRTPASARHSGLGSHVAATPSKPIDLVSPRRSIVRIPRQPGVSAINVADRNCLLAGTRPAKVIWPDIDVGLLVTVTSTGN
jgi:hypothetical protein